MYPPFDCVSAHIYEPDRRCISIIHELHPFLPILYSIPSSNPPIALPQPQLDLLTRNPFSPSHCQFRRRFNLFSCAGSSSYPYPSTPEIISIYFSRWVYNHQERGEGDRCLIEWHGSRETLRKLLTITRLPRFD